MTGEKLIKTAEKYIGENSSKFTKAYGVPANTSWCSIFVWYIFKACSCSQLFYGGAKCAYVPSAEIWLRAHCKRISPTKAKPGDVIIFTWSNNRRDHIGFVKKYIGSGILETIEGNTYIPGRVAIRKRPVSNVYAIYRPNYDEHVKKTYLQTYPKRALPVLNKHGEEKYLGKKDKGYNVQQLQRFLNWFINSGLVVDGIYGPKTEKAVKKWQKVQKLNQTGKFGETSLGLARKVKK